MPIDPVSSAEPFVSSRTVLSAGAGAAGALLLAGALWTAPAAAPAAAEGPAVAPASAAVATHGPQPRDADRVRVELDAKIDAARKRWQARDEDWFSLEQEASALMGKAKLTGDLDYLTDAEQRLDKAFERAPPKSGPWVSQAKLKLTLHKVDQADQALAGYDATVLKQRQKAAGADLIRADIALQRGDYSAAAKHLEHAVRLAPVVQPSVLVRTAYIHEQLGEKDKAASILDGLVDGVGDRQGLDPAWTLLRRGILELDRGEVKTALGWFDRADKALPGWYLVMEHRAECLARLGELDASEALYREVIAKNPSPEFYAALAGVLEAKGEPEAAQAMNDEARRGFTRLLESHPEAMFGHALDWYLEGDDVKTALMLAERNVALRPSWEAKTKLLLAQIRSGKLDDAQRTLTAVKASPYRHPDLFGAEAFLLRRAGDDVGADAALARAEQLEKGAAAGYDWLRPASS